MKIIAHRCGTDKHPEQTMQSALYSIEAGVDFVEADIRYTRDARAVICHDDTAINLFGYNKKISEMSAAEFIALRHTGAPDYHAHILEDIFNAGIRKVLFHVKEGGDRMKILLNHIKNKGYEDDVIIGVVSCDDATAVKRFNRNISVLAFMEDGDIAAEYAACGADIIRLWEGQATEENISMIKSLGTKVWIMAGKEKLGYTDDNNLKLWNNLGVDGVLLNDITRAVTMLKGSLKIPSTESVKKQAEVFYV